ncbi:MAG: MFS transporter [Bacteroidaceae bacterium]|nr:MFS transporter [Bacteroidaceae bacterium]
MFSGHPKGLWALALANTGERFGYYTMLAVFFLFLQHNFGFDVPTAGTIQSVFLGVVYFVPLFGGMLADKFGFGKMVTTGILVMFLGYLLLALPLGAGTIALGVMALALLFVCVGTGLFKGNLQVLVGNLYDDPKYSAKRDEGFSIFYMAINIGSMFAAAAALGIMAYVQESYGVSKADSYHYAFAVACISLIFSIIIYYTFRGTFAHADRAKAVVASDEKIEELTPSQTKERIVCLCLVFAVVIFFWMAFHQNGTTMTQFAEIYTAKSDSGISSLMFNVWNLVLVILSVYGLLNIFQSKTAKGKLIASVLFLASAGYLAYQAVNVTGSVDVEAPIFQQFNPCFVVALTPIVMLVFGALSKRGKEPSSPMKIGLGMLVAGVGFVVLLIGSKGLNTPDVQEADQVRYEKAHLQVTVDKAELLMKQVALPIVEETSDSTTKTSYVVNPMYGDSEVLPMSYMTAADKEVVKAVEVLDKKDAKRSDIIDVQKVLVAQYDSIYNVCEEKLPATLKSQIQEQDVIAQGIAPVGYVSPNWLIMTYFILTIAELLLSPIGISFVSKVAPPKYKGMMMGGWFVATAIGNFLVAVPALLWGSRSLYVVWGVLIAVCLVSALFIFSILKRLEKVAK